MAYAANLLGLSDQAPARLVFLTIRRNRRIRFGKLDIVLKHTFPRSMAAGGRTSRLVIQALRYLGKPHVTDDTVKRLDRAHRRDSHRGPGKQLNHSDLWHHQRQRRGD